LFERTVEHIVNAITIYVFTVDDAALQTFQKTMASENGEMLHRRFDQSELRREEPLQMLPAVSALMVAMHLQR